MCRFHPNSHSDSFQLCKFGIFQGLYLWDVFVAIIASKLSPVFVIELWTLGICYLLLKRLLFRWQITNIVNLDSGASVANGAKSTSLSQNDDALPRTQYTSIYISRSSRKGSSDHRLLPLVCDSKSQQRQLIAGRAVDGAPFE